MNVGLIPGDGSAWTLPRTVGMAKACELFFCCDTIDAQTALSIGLINYVADHDKLLDKANELAAKIAARPPQALRLTKRLIRNAQYSTFEHSMQDAAAFQSFCHYTDDHMEALSAMFEKRNPQFMGK
jgi:enoyl-CoA hydratase/carnithine racemase